MILGHHYSADRHRYSLNATRLSLKEAFLSPFTPAMCVGTLLRSYPRQDRPYRSDSDAAVVRPVCGFDIYFASFPRTVQSSMVRSARLQPPNATIFMNRNSNYSKIRRIQGFWRLSLLVLRTCHCHGMIPRPSLARASWRVILCSDQVFAWKSALLLARLSSARRPARISNG